MSTETSNVWKKYRSDQQKRRLKRLPLRTQSLLKLCKEGFKIEEKTQYHFRVNNRLDVWPIHNRYHDIKKNRRGGFRNVANFVRNFFANN
ncbi:unnamed protein product [marine sediment metagenome]|uniref:Uncharacterized protein n=1 Tax=marine sediment metagenome TaxID=412755 RepID=X1KBD9_9ZZZZ